MSAAQLQPALPPLEYTGLVRAIDTATITSVVVMDDRFIQQHPGADLRFMEALHAAWDMVRREPEQAAEQFKSTSDLPFDLEVLTLAASVEPNMGAASPGEVRVHLTPAEVAGIQDAADFMHAAGLLRTPTRVSSLLLPQATRPTLSPRTDASVRERRRP